MRIGPTMRLLHDTASALPGLSQRGLLRACELPECGMGHTRPAQRAARAGLLVYRRAWQGNAWRIYASDRDAELDDLRAELMRGSPTPERAAELAAQIERLREQQAQTWVAA